MCAGPVARGTQDFAPFGAAAPDGQAGSWPETCMRSACCGLARYHLSAHSEEVTVAWILAEFPWEIPTVWAEIPILGTLGWVFGRNGESADWWDAGDCVCVFVRM